LTAVTVLLQMNQLRLVIITDMKSRHVMSNKLPATMFYWYGITDTADIAYLRTFDE